MIRLYQDEEGDFWVVLVDDGLVKFSAYLSPLNTWRNRTDPNHYEKLEDFENNIRLMYGLRQ